MSSAQMRSSSFLRSTRMPGYNRERPHRGTLRRGAVPRGRAPRGWGEEG
jgi:hypothetical protein